MLHAGYLVSGHRHEDKSVHDIAPTEKDIYPHATGFLSRSIGVKYRPGSSFCTKQKVVLRLVTKGIGQYQVAHGPEKFKEVYLGMRGDIVLKLTVKQA